MCIVSDILIPRSKYFMFTLYGSVPSLEMSCFHGWNKYTRLLNVQYCLLSSHCPYPFLPSLYSWTRLSLKRPAARCHALLCTNVIQTHSTTLAQFTPSSSVWRVNVHIWTFMGQWLHLGHWHKPFTRHHLHILKFEHRHTWVLFHCGTEILQNQYMEMKNLKTICRSLVQSSGWLSYGVLFTVEKQHSAA